MQFLKRFFDFYIFSNIHVAFGTFCFVKITLITQGVYTNDTACFVFFSTILSYNFIRFTNISTTKNWMTSWYIQHKILLILVSVLSGIGALFFLFKLNRTAILVLIPFMLLTFFYGINLPRMASSLRTISGVKTFLIAFCYAGITVIFPLVQNSIEIDVSIVPLFIQRFFFVLLITIPFDIRDVQFDSSRLQTIPQYLGVRNSKVMGGVLAILVVLIETKLVLDANNSQIIVFIITGMALILLLFSKKKQSKYYSSFWVEAIPIFWLLLLKMNLIFGV